MPLYAATVFLSAFLLFLVQPLIAKRILPWFGGSAAVWTTCLVFFQAALLLGYLYAHALTRRLSARRQALLHIALLATSLLLLPLAPSESWRPRGGEDPTWRILGLLTTSIGLPYLLLSATSPLLQAWYARTHPGAPAYRLFALSNAASLLALLGYPLALEPYTAIRAQALGWSAGFALFAALCGFLSWRVTKTDMTQSAASPDAPRPSGREQALWLALAFCGSTLLLAITNHLTQNLAPLPFLWVLPLATYLLTFILAFEGRGWYRRGLCLRLLAVALGSMAYDLYEIGFAGFVQIGIPLFVAGLFIGCLFCHGELSLRKPAPAHLTLFYLLISLGGALGAVFVGLLAPRLFVATYELPVSFLLTAALACLVTWRDGWGPRLLWTGATAAMGVLVVGYVYLYEHDALAMMRSFYGGLRVLRSGTPPDRLSFTLYHGTIKHGSQYLLPSRRMTPTTYYAPDSGIGLALDACCSGPKRVGVVGLGTGTLAAYGRKGDAFRFYEINPQVQRLANSLFTYLRGTPAQTQVALGDARLLLEREPPQSFDVLAVDAFSGDAIPVHLLTREAVALYLRHLKPTGILAFHISNQYLNLAPIVRSLADAHGRQTLLIKSELDPDQDEAATEWVLVASGNTFQRLPALTEEGEPAPARADLRLWTDDYSSLLPALRALH